ncbi:protein SUPPRESSOR OF QUENCHING 1, chloroplastic-like [Salvia hispanica]|uniref:protein SUPPRESSOR OF QUENCHING 1, chloroplastic-like n=1 Tax=Salvia hispanica TaxID=49212 RepID=UPI0020094A6F|nr:protein SUPPRESSOR OF QUENCHING 1, chloroplastic-like [Salvia hispanica]
MALRPVVPTPSETGSEWGNVSAVLFDMDGVLCNSEDLSRLAAVDVFAEMGVQVTAQDFVPFMGTGEANFLGGVASVKGVKGFNPESAKKRFFELYLDKYAKPNSGIGFPGAYELIVQCKNHGLKVAVASSADRIKVDANLAAAGLKVSMFDAVVSADAFENLKPAPDIFLAASKILGVPTNECLVIEDALAGVQAAKSACMRCIAVTTTLGEDTLRAAGPSLIRKEIGDICFNDILNGGSD